MFCNKCGNKFVDESVFCTECGASRKADAAASHTAPTPAAPAPAVMAAPVPNMPVQAAPAPRKSGMNKKIIIPIASVVAILLVGVAVFAFVGNPFASAADDRQSTVFDSFIDEAGERIAASPLQAFVILGDMVSTGAGTFDVSFDYRSGSMWNPDVNGSVTLASDFNNFNHALTGEVRVMGMPVDFRAFLNNERLAVGSDLIGRENFGVTFSTLHRDLEDFGRTFGIDQWTMWDLMDAADMITAALGGTTDLFDFSGFGTQFEELFSNFFDRIEPTVSSTTIGGTSVERTVYTITERDVFALLDDLLRTLEVDNALASMLGDELAWAIGFGDLNWFVREMRNELRELERWFTGRAEFALYVSTSGRLMRANFDMSMSFDGDRINLWATLDLGTSVTDTWRLDIGVRDDWGGDTVSITWDFEDTHRGYENIIRIMTGWETIVLDSVWNPSTGNFTLGIDDGWWTSESFSGRFTLNNDGGFTLAPERIVDHWSGDTFDFSITLTPGASIPNVDFINMNRWDAGLLDMIERSILGLLW